MTPTNCPGLMSSDTSLTAFVSPKDFVTLVSRSVASCMAAICGAKRDLLLTPT